MPIPVLIDLLAEELDALPEEACVYLNRKSGEFVTFPNHDVGIVEDGLEEEEEFEWDYPPEAIAQLREIVESTHWITLPDKHDIHEWSIMQRFADSVPEPLSSNLNRAIHGRGAFRSFRNELDRSGRTQAWYDFKHEHLVALLSEILTDEDVPFRRGRV